MACKEYIQEISINEDGVDNLWSIVSEEIKNGAEGLTSACEALYRQMRLNLENRLKGKTQQHGVNKDQQIILKEEQTLFGEYLLLM